MVGGSDYKVMEPGVGSMVKHWDGQTGYLVDRRIPKDVLEYEFVPLIRNGNGLIRNVTQSISTFASSKVRIDFTSFMPIQISSKKI